MGEVVELQPFRLKRLGQQAAELTAQLFEFAKSGGPIVEGADPYAGCVIPEGIDGLLYETSLGFSTPYDAG